MAFYSLDGMIVVIVLESIGVLIRPEFCHSYFIGELRFQVISSFTSRIVTGNMSGHSSSNTTFSC
jgi:hypothetical protein